jgi:hypothetical protein
MRLRNLLAAALLVTAVGCAEHALMYGAPASLPNGANVDLRRAYLADDRLFVEAYIINASKEPMRIDRDKFSLRLPDGRILPRSMGTTSTHNVYTLEPGQGHQVNVDFRSDALTRVSRATLLLGGVLNGVDLAPRFVGEIPLTSTPVVAAPPEPPPPPSPPPPPPPN